MTNVGTPSAIFLQSTAFEPLGAKFGDGVLCIAGTIVRLGSKATPSGIAQYPELGNQSVAQKGQVVPGSGAARFYQTCYRNASATFCPPATFNVTNSVSIIW
jgi:hypothetical protein